ncbi:host specificity factor TipJ family phage tail protein, partial [Pseudomonas sp.]|uniref:host specificity factor TipJ family phage tail protein n=1 Tax=Pseudomonas sp. TaxID=306 RepID=UPI00261DD0C2
RIKLPRQMRATVQMRRIGHLNNSVQSHSQVTWFGLKARLPDVRVYKNWTTIGVTMQSGGKIATQSESRLNAIVTRILPELQSDGSWSEPKPTRDIASFVRYLAHTIGYNDNDIDMTELLRLHNTYWKPRGEHFDYIFDETTVKQALDYAFNAGLSDFTISNGKIKPVRDDIRTISEQSYSAQNTVGEITHTFRSRQLDDFDGVEVEYVDPETFDKKVVECILPDSQGIKLRKTSLRGVTDRDRAYIAGMRLASEDLYVNREFSFKTEMDAFNSEYGSFIRVITESPNMMQSSQILNAEKDHVVLSEDIPVDFDVFAWRDAQGRYNGEHDIIRVDGNKVYVDLGSKKPIVSLGMELPHAYIGKKERFTYKCLVDEITPNGVDSATVKASIYDGRVYAYDNKE